MIIIKCDICNKECSQFNFYKLKLVPYQVSNQEITKRDSFHYDWMPLDGEFYICKNCKLAIEKGIEEIKAEAINRVDNTDYNEKEDRV